VQRHANILLHTLQTTHPQSKTDNDVHSYTHAHIQVFARFIDDVSGLLAIDRPRVQVETLSSDRKGTFIQILLLPSVETKGEVLDPNLGK